MFSSINWSGCLRKPPSRKITRRKRFSEKSIPNYWAIDPKYKSNPIPKLIYLPAKKFISPLLMVNFSARMTSSFNYEQRKISSLFWKFGKGFSLLRIHRKHGCVLTVPARPSSHKILVSQSHYSEIEIVEDVFITAFTSWPQRGPESAESLKKVKHLIKRDCVMSWIFFYRSSEWNQYFLCAFLILCCIGKKSFC